MNPLTQVQAVVASQIFFLLTMGLTSLSLILLMRRIFSTNTKHKVGSYILLGVISAWLVLAVAAVKSNCPSTHILEGQEHTCANDVSVFVSIYPTLLISADISMESYSCRRDLHRGCRDGLADLSCQPSPDQSEQENARRLCFCVSNAVCGHLSLLSILIADTNSKYDHLFSALLEGLQRGSTLRRKSTPFHETHYLAASFDLLQPLVSDSAFCSSFHAQLYDRRYGLWQYHIWFS